MTTENQLDTVARRVAHARQIRGLNCLALSNAAGLSKAYVTMLEAAGTDAKGTIENPSLASLAKLATALSVSVEWLAFGTGDGPREPDDAQGAA